MDRRRGRARYYSVFYTGLMVDKTGNMAKYIKTFFSAYALAVVTLQIGTGEISVKER